MTMTKSRELTLCALFVALIAAGAFIRVPIPVLPFTMQSMFALLAGVLLGAKRGCLSVCVYLALGLMGLPVFTMGGGPAYVLQPSFGYLIGFAAGAFVAGTVAGRTGTPSYRRLLAANFAGLIPVYGIGVVYYGLISNFYLHDPMGLRALLVSCFLMTLPGDIVKSLLGALLAKRLLPVLSADRT